ncbi:unnamed protein product, partial [Candidula unifasciata]
NTSRVQSECKNKNRKTVCKCDTENINPCSCGQACQCGTGCTCAECNTCKCTADSCKCGNQCTGSGSCKCGSGCGCK